MAQSKRRFFNIGDHSDPHSSESNDESAIEPVPTTVSSILRSAREQTGLTVWEVSQNLRIRFSYMQAIEDGRFDDLPGTVYAIGFIRTYGLYLNLDADELVRRFKNEQSGLTERQDLVFPAPPPDSRVSGLMIGVVALLLAGAAYGGWYYMSEQNSREAAVVAPVPDRFATLLEEEGPSPVAVPADEPLASTALDEPDPTDSEEGDDPSVETASDLEPEPIPQANDGPGLVDQAQAADVGDIPLPVLAVEEEPPSPPVVAEETVEQFAAVDLTDVVPLESAALNPADPSQEEASGPPNAPAAPEVGSQTAIDGVRVLMRATADSWVLIRDANGDMIMTRVMTPGDSWEAPNDAGLTLFTGNAGGLEILVDGQAAPAVGGPGEVIRNISLDPDLLRDGRAVISR